MSKINGSRPLIYFHHNEPFQQMLKVAITLKELYCYTIKGPKVCYLNCPTFWVNIKKASLSLGYRGTNTFLCLVGKRVQAYDYHKFIPCYHSKLGEISKGEK
jgi:hypothetical protein